MSTTSTSAESEVVSGFDFQDTVLKLGLPGGGGVGLVRGGVVAENGERKRGFFDAVELTLGNNKTSSRPSASIAADRTVDSEESMVSGTSKPPAAKVQVVGWPPVRSFRKNVLKSCKYVKVAVDGAPYLRKVDLEIYNGYQQLLTALEEMFSCFTIRNYPDERRLVDPVNGKEYVPTYEDKEGDWMLVGDVPWKLIITYGHDEEEFFLKTYLLFGSEDFSPSASQSIKKMFVESCKRLRLMKSSEAVNLAPRTPQRSTNAN